MSSKKDFAAYLLGEGINYRSYDYMGSHRAENGYVFRVCAPDADRAFLVGDFNGWGDDIPLRRISASGIWEGFAHSHKIAVGDKYKYRIHKGDDVFYLPDPYSTHAATPPETASLIPCDDDYAWNDGGWMSFRKKYAFESYRLPMNVYGIHLASWKRYSDGAPLELDKLAAELAPYVKQMGYTHIELVPHRSAECSDDAFFSPESLYGVSGCLKAFVDHMHMAGIGVIFDLDMSRFFKNRYVYASYSGYNLGRNEMKSLLISSTDYLVRCFHADGLKFLGTGKAEQLDIRHLNAYLKREFPDSLLIAGENMNFPRLTGFGDGGLGFDMACNQRWLSDTLAYASLEACERKNNHSKLNFPATYAFDEKYVLPISDGHLTGVKRSFIESMTGDYWQKFAAVRAFMGYMLTYPGKKLSFMGNEIGQFRKWSPELEVEWFLLDYEMHAKLQRCVCELNHLYLTRPQLWQIDRSWDGFRWIDPDNAAQSIISYRRIAEDGSELIVLINFTPSVHHGFLLGVERAGVYREIFNSDSTSFGGSGVVNAGALKNTGESVGRSRDSIKITVPPLAIVIFEADGGIDRS